MTETTHLYLIRHGIAADATDYPTDEQRPLTLEGGRKTRKVAQRLLELNLHFDLILTSPLVRARQTAQILHTVGLASHIEESTALVPGGGLKLWLVWLEAWRQKGGKELAIVGHQPDLSNWAEIFLWGEVRNVLTLKKAGIIGLTIPATESPIGHSQMFWLTPPKFLLN